MIAKSKSKRGKPNAALLLVIAILLGVTAIMGWLVGSGLSKGETFFPSKRATQQRNVSRQQEPVTFWISIGVYTAIGASTLALGVLGARAGRRS